MTLVVERSSARKLWWPRDGYRWPPRSPRLAQIVRRGWHALVGHPWGRWRVETEEWFEYVDEPVEWAWHACRSCGTIEHVRPAA